MLCNFEKFKSFALSTEIVKYYKEDIDLDERILNKYGNQQYVWLLRECGTLLFPTNIGINSFYIEYYANNDSTARFFLVNGLPEVDFKEISKEKALKLAKKEPIDFSLILDLKDLISKVEKLLSNKDISSKVFSDAIIQVHPCAWEKWRTWFKENEIMSNTMTKALLLLTKMQTNPIYQ